MNSPFDNLLQLILSVQVWQIAKILVSFGLFLYIIFAFVVVKQVSVMTETLQQLELPLKIVSTLYLIFVIFVFLLAIAIL